jgi:hypothetical protein
MKVKDELLRNVEQCGTIISAWMAVSLVVRTVHVVGYLSRRTDARHIELDMTEAVAGNLKQTWDVSREPW